MRKILLVFLSININIFCTIKLNFNFKGFGKKVIKSFTLNNKKEIDFSQDNLFFVVFVDDEGIKKDQLKFNVEVYKKDNVGLKLMLKPQFITSIGTKTKLEITQNDNEHINFTLDTNIV